MDWYPSPDGTYLSFGRHDSFVGGCRRRLKSWGRVQALTWIALTAEGRGEQPTRLGQGMREVISKRGGERGDRCRQWRRSNVDGGVATGHSPGCGPLPHSLEQKVPRCRHRGLSQGEKLGGIYWLSSHACVGLGTAPPAELVDGNTWSQPYETGDIYRDYERYLGGWWAVGPPWWLPKCTR